MTYKIIWNRLHINLETTERELQNSVLFPLDNASTIEIDHSMNTIFQALKHPTTKQREEEKIAFRKSVFFLSDWSVVQGAVFQFFFCC